MVVIYRSNLQKNTLVEIKCIKEGITNAGKLSHEGSIENQTKMENI